MAMWVQYSYCTEWSPGYDGSGRTTITRNIICQSLEKQENRVFTQYIVVGIRIYWVESNHHVAHEIHCTLECTISKKPRLLYNVLSGPHQQR